MLLATHSVAALPQPEYLGYTSALSIIRGGKIVDKITAHVKALVYRSAQASLVNCNTCTHGGGDANFLDVHAFRLSRFCFFQRNQQSFQVFFQFVSVKVHFTDGGVDDAVFVVTVTNLASFSVFNRLDRKSVV